MICQMLMSVNAALPRMGAASDSSSVVAENNFVEDGGESEREMPNATLQISVAVSSYARSTANSNAFFRADIIFPVTLC